MSTLSIVHMLVGLVAVIIGSVIVGQRKGSPRHRVLGWIYAGCLLTSLTAIIVRSLSHHPTPFHWYAAIIMGAIVAAVLASRYRRRDPGVGNHLLAHARTR